MSCNDISGVRCVLKCVKWNLVSLSLCVFFAPFFSQNFSHSFNVLLSLILSFDLGVLFICVFSSQ